MRSYRGGSALTNERSKCIDAGSDYCPCYLAETNDCLTCTHLQGKGFCDCSWCGVCIYQDFSWCGNKKKDFRQESEGIIVKKQLIGEKGLIFRIKVSKTLARQLKQPGSYIFIREPEKPHFFDVPMSIMLADEYKGEIEVAIQLLGIKTKSLLNCEEKIMVKGPYWNGILGLKDLKTTRNENVLIVARGIALAPSLLVINYLLKNNNRVTFAMDPGKIGEFFILDYLMDMKINTQKINLRSDRGLDKIKDCIQSGRFDLLFSGGADKLHNILLNEINTNGKPIKFAATNNSHICCGEGICGACICKTSDGNTAKMCKCQIDVKEALGKGEK